MTYYTHTNGLPADQTRAIAGNVRDEFDKIALAFTTLPPSASLYGDSANYAADTGAANALVVAVNSQIVAYTDGLTLKVLAANANTGACTINVNSLGFVAIQRPDGSPLQANDVFAGQVCQLTYVASVPAFQLSMNSLNAAQNAAASAAASAASAAASAASASASSASASASAASASNSSSSATASANSATASANSATASAGSATAAAASATAAAQTFNGTSTTSMTLATGTQTFTTQTGKAWVLGQSVTIAAGTGSLMSGVVSAYNISTGAMTVIVSSVTGSGTFASWSIGIQPSNGVPTALPIVPVTSNMSAVAGSHYELTGAYTLTLPTSPNKDDVIEITNVSGLLTPVVDFGSLKLRGQSPGAMTVVDINFKCRLQWTGNSTYGWA